jgi:hypothetical protein
MHSWEFPNPVGDMDYNPLQYQLACVYHDGFAVIDLFAMAFKVKKTVKRRLYQSLAFSNDGQRLFVGFQNGIDVYDIREMDEWPNDEHVQEIGSDVAFDLS